MTLSPRETEVIRLMCEGKTAKQIARELGMSHRTAEVHRSNAFRRMGARNAAHAAAMFTKEQQP